MATIHLDNLAKEENYRRLFDESDPEVLNNPHLGLLNLFGNPHLFKSEDYDSTLAPTILDQPRLSYQRPTGESLIVDKPQFLQNWENFTRGSLAGLDWSNVFVAGGSIFSCVCDQKQGFETSDIDIFLYGLDPESDAIQDKLRHIVETVVKNTGATGEVRFSSKAATIFVPYPYNLIQVIMCTYATPSQVLLSFDIDCACLGFDGTDVWALERCRLALATRINFYTLVPADNHPQRYEKRLFKYSKRGFGVVLEQSLYDQYKDDSKINDPEIKIHTMEGPPLLLRYHAIQSGPHNHFFVNYSNSIDETIQGGRLKCKICHQIFSRDSLSKETNEMIDFYGTVTPIEWVTKNLVFQDIDTGAGFQRTFQQRKFVPRVEPDWEKGLYTTLDAPSALGNVGVVFEEEIGAGYENLTEQDISNMDGETITNHLKILTEQEEPRQTPQSGETQSLASILILISTCWKEGLINNEERGKLKEIVLLGRNTEQLTSPISVFYDNNNLPQLATAFKSIL